MFRLRESISNLENFRLLFYMSQSDSEGSQIMFKKLSLFVLILTLTIMGLPGVQASEVTTINYWHYLSGENADIHEELVHRFNEEHPHIHVDVLFTGNQFVTRD